MKYRFNDLSIDTESYRIESDGRPVQIEPRVFDLLVYLIENRERVVTRDELLDTLWKGRVVTDSAVTARLKAARKAVGDDGLRQEVIKTVHRRGYQFVAPIAASATVEPDVQNEGPSDDPPLTLPANPSIAVLPFTNLSADPEQEIFADGLTEDIITDLSRFRDLFVIASNSCFVYKGMAVRIQEVSHELGVQYVLEGSVQKSGGQVRISVQLIDGRTARHLWAQRYDRELEDLFKVQNEITQMVVGTLASGYGGRLRKAWQTEAIRAAAGGQRARPRSILAFDCFMRGLDSVDQSTWEGLMKGRELFRRAVELDPGYSRAWGKLAWTYLLELADGWADDPAGTLKQARAHALRGIDADDNESWAHWPLSAYYFHSGRFDLGLVELEKAVELNPNDADILVDHGYYLSYLGRAKEGLAIALKAMRLNPHYPEWYVVNLIQIYYDAGEYENAIAAFARLHTETALALVYLSASYAALDRLDEARTSVARLSTLDPGATLKKWTNPTISPYKLPEDSDRFRKDLQKAGLPPG